MASKTSKRSFYSQTTEKRKPRLRMTAIKGYKTRTQEKPPEKLHEPVAEYTVKTTQAEKHKLAPLKTKAHRPDIFLEDFESSYVHSNPKPTTRRPTYADIRPDSKRANQTRAAIKRNKTGK